MKKFIAYFDYLGFKQFIENNDLTYQKKIMGNNFRDIENALGQGKLKEATHGVISDLSLHKINCINFSDTIVFWSNDDSEDSLNEILQVAHRFNWQATTYFFPARGSIVYGEIEYIDFKNENISGGVYNINSVFGRGLVDAHQKAESQQWSGTVIDTSFIEELQNRGIDVDSLLAPYARKYIVPYKNGIKLAEEYALRLIKGELNPVAFDNVAHGIKENFKSYNKDASHPDVQEKIENTIEFLNGVRSSTAFSNGDYEILRNHFRKSELNQFYLFVIKRVLYVKKFSESEDKVIPALMKTLTDRVGKTSVNPETDEEITLLIETLYAVLMAIDITEVYNTDI
ncbi:MAG: hypothetical protein ACJA1C_001990 [Crocinitomicaceae bacterium]|jgi:hypothetical protein